MKKKIRMGKTTEKKSFCLAKTLCVWNKYDVQGVPK